MPYRISPQIAPSSILRCFFLVYISFGCGLRLLADPDGPLGSERPLREIALKNHVERNQTAPEKTEVAKVRFGLKIILPGRDTGLERSTGSRIKRYTLRAAALKTNHFYFGKWHIVTTPKSWNRHNRNFSMGLAFFQLYGRNQEVEEKLGTMTLRGVLKGSESPYILEGVARQIFKNKHGSMVAEVVAGYQASAGKELATKPETGASPRERQGPSVSKLRQRNRTQQHPQYTW